MATHINGYNVSLGLDASNFVDGAKLSRSEMRMLNKEIESIKSPVEKFAEAQERYARALSHGQISQEQYNAVLSRTQEHYEQLAGSSSTADTVIHGLGIAFTASAAAAVAAAGAGAAFVAWMHNVQSEIDKTADKASTLGLSFNELNNLRFGFAEGAGIDAGVVEESIKKLQVNLAKAVEGDEATRAAFAKLGLDAGQLMGLGPQQALLEIADKMQGVGTHAERLKLAMDLFGKSGAALASTLGRGRDALAEAMAYQEKWNGLSEEQVASVGLLNDSWGRTSLVITGVTNKLAAELAPVFSVVAQDVLGMAEGFEDADKVIRKMVDQSVQLAANFYDSAQYAYRIATFGYGGQAVSELSTAEQWMKKIEEQREKARHAAAVAEKEREQARSAMALLDTEKEYQEKLDAAKKIADEQKRLDEQADRERRMMAAASIREAEQYFKEQEQRQIKMLTDVSKGPGAGMEANSAEAAKYLAQQANMEIAKSMWQDLKPNEEKLLEEAKRLYEFNKQDAAEKDRKLQKLIEAVEENGFQAVGT